MAVTETRLNNDKPPIPYKGYNFENVNSPTAAGGVGVYVSNSLNYSLRNDLKLNASHCEDIWINIELKDNQIFVLGVIYRHPGHNYSLFCERMCETLNKLNLSKTKYMIVGDMNINLHKYNLVSNVTNYVNALNSVGCNICIDKPTRISRNSNSTCIDHVYSNMELDRIDTHIITSNMSDHFSTLSNIKSIQAVRSNPDIYYRKTSLSSEQWNAFNTELYSILSSELSSDIIDDDVNVYASKISDAYKQVIDKYMPLLKRKPSKRGKHSSHKPWMWLNY